MKIQGWGGRFQVEEMPSERLDSRRTLRCSGKTNKASAPGAALKRAGLTLGTEKRRPDQVGPLRLCSGRSEGGSPGPPGEHCLSSPTAFTAAPSYISASLIPSPSIRHVELASLLHTCGPTLTSFRASLQPVSLPPAAKSSLAGIYSTSAVTTGNRRA